MAWPKVNLGEVASLARETVLASRIAPGTLYVGLENIQPGGSLFNVGPVSEGELLSSKFAFSRAHVLFGKLRPYLAKVALPEFDGVCSTDILPIAPNEKLDRRYLACYLLTPRMVDLASSKTTGVSLPRLSPSALLDLPIPLPPLEEQQRIADMLDKAHSLAKMRGATLGLTTELSASAFLAEFGEPLANPKGWRIRRLHQLTTKIGSGATPTGGEAAYASDGIALIRSMNVRDNRFEPKGLARITQAQAARLDNVTVESKDVLLNHGGKCGSLMYRA